MKNGVELYRKIGLDNQAQEQIRMRFWMKSILEDFPELKKPRELKSLEDCMGWFKDYKKAIKSKDKEWEYCRMTLAEFDAWEPRMTKNQAYLKENALVVNQLYKHYVLA